MKKMLLATTSIVAVGLGSSAAQAQWDVNVGGSMSQWFVGVGQDVSSHNGTHVNGNTEIHFTGRNTLDNGLTFGFKVELEGDSFSGGAVDESVLFVQSADYGRFEIGMEDSAGKQMLITGPSVGFAANSGTWTDFVRPRLASGNGITSVGFIGNSPAYTTLQSAGGDSDDPKITYYTPRFYGFQFGVSYTPDTGAGGDNSNFIGAGGATAGAGISYLHGVDGGINYVESFGPVDVSASGSLYWATGPSGAVTFQESTLNLGRTATTTLGDDFFAWNAGASISYAGFTLGGSYVSVESGERRVIGTGAFPVVANALGTPTQVAVATNEGDGWEIGLTYEQGPWAFGVSYFTGVQEGIILNPDRDFVQNITGGVSYDLAPGVTVLGSIGFVETDTEFVSGGTFAAVPVGAGPGGVATTTTSGFPGSDDNSGVYGGVGIALSF